MSRSDLDYHHSWADALILNRDNFYVLPNFHTTPAIASMVTTLKDGAYGTITHKSFTYTAATARKRGTLPRSDSDSDSSPVLFLPSPRPSSSSSISISDCGCDCNSSPNSSEEGAEFLFGWAESRKERRHANRELKKNTRLNKGMYRVKERLAIFREEEECGFCFCFGEDSDGDEGCESEDEVGELICDCDESEEDENVFDGGEGLESEDSDSLCCNENGDDGSSVDQDEENGDDGNDDGEDGEEKYAGSEKDEEDSDDELKTGTEQVKGRKRKARKSVSWKADDNLTEIHIVAREDLSMEYVFGQERATMMKEDGTSNFASKKATKKKDPAATEPTMKQTTRGGSHRINSNDEAEFFVFGQQQVTTTKANQQSSDSLQKVSMTSGQQQTIPKDTEAKASTIVQTAGEEAFVFGRQSKIQRKNEPKHIARTTITVTEFQPEPVAEEPEEAFVFGKQPGVWRQSESD